MDFIHGKIVETRELDCYIDDLIESINKTLTKPPLSHHIVIQACDTLIQSTSDATLSEKLAATGMSLEEVEATILKIKLMFSKEYLLQRVERELGTHFGKVEELQPMDVSGVVFESMYPLGVLFHIAAGNVDALPVYSVIEGLLTGNINLLKLPSVDNGLTIEILNELCKIEPILQEYIYVFELSSKDITSISKLIRLAHGVVVWGGDEAIKTFRAMTPANTKLIEWGHKLSFCYVTEKGNKEESIQEIAKHVCATNQLLCSSCQGVFYESTDKTKLLEFSKTLLASLDQQALNFDDNPLEVKAQITLSLKAKSLEAVNDSKVQVLKGKKASVILDEEQSLTGSMQYKNVWVKSLMRDQIVTHLHHHKNHLQTVGLVCGDDEWEELRNLFWQAGVVRVSRPSRMTESYCGGAHDGELVLRKYVRIVSSEKQ